MKKDMKSLFLVIVMVIFGLSNVVYALSPSDIADDYTASLAYESGGKTYIDKFHMELEASGLYYVYENRQIGENSFRYPSLIGSYFINDKENVVLNVEGTLLELEKVSDNAMVGFEQGIAVNLTSANACTFRQTCEYDIFGESIIEGTGTYYVSTNSSGCWYDVSLSDGVFTVTYTKQGDAVVKIDTTNVSDNVTSVELQAGNAVKTIKVEDTVNRTLQ